MVGVRPGSIPRPVLICERPVQAGGLAGRIDLDARFRRYRNRASRSISTAKLAMDHSAFSLRPIFRIRGRELLEVFGGNEPSLEHLTPMDVGVVRLMGESRAMGLASPP